MENIEKKNTKLDFKLRDQRISLINNNGVFEITLFVKKNSKWHKNVIIPLITLEKNQIIHASEIISSNHSSEDDWLIKVANESRSDIYITTTIEANDDFRNWIHFNTTINFQKEQQFSKIGPELKILLVPEADFSTNGTLIKQPTRHTPPTEEWKSNDMPAATIWNPQSKVQTYFFVDFTKMDWMAPETVERFSIYECGLGSNKYFGLIHRVPFTAPITFPVGFQISFDFYISQEYREKRPNLWEAVELLITKCFTLLPSHIPFPQKNLSWTQFAYGCIKDLMKEKFCWIDSKSPKYFAYVMDEAENKRREAIGRTDIFETMTLLSVLPPWILNLQINPDKNQEKHVKATCKTIDYFIDPNTKFLYNNIIYSPEGNHQIIRPTKLSIGDSWYFFEPILRYGWLIRFLPMISDDEGPHYQTFKIMAEKSIEFVKKHEYEITAFYDPFTLKPLDEVLKDNLVRKQKMMEIWGRKDIIWKQRAKNYACLALFIYIMIQAFYLSQESQFLEEAKIAAKKMIQFSPDQLFWEPFELAYGVAGLAELGRITENYEFLSQAKRLLLNELRMFYWYNDPSFGWKDKRNNLGLPMACIGIRYPAMKENVESIYPWLIFIKIAFLAGKTQLISTGIMKFFNLIRINSFYFFSKVLPKELIYPPRRNSPCSFIPFEDLEMLETPPHFSDSQERTPKGQRTGTLGREIYGAGEVILLYLMFEALANCKSSEIMILNLDLFDFPFLKSFPPQNLHYILFNPLSSAKTCYIAFYSPKAKQFQLKIRSFYGKQKEQVLVITQEENKEGITFDLGAEETLFIELIAL